MNTGLREFTGWARLKMLSGLQEQRAVVKLNDAMVAAEMRKNFGDDFEMKQDDDVMIGRDFVQPSPAPIVIMPQAPAVPPNRGYGWIIATIVVSMIPAFILFLVIVFGSIWFFFRPTVPPIQTPVQTSGDNYDIKLFVP